MSKDITYPTVDRVIEYNLLVLTVIKAKKADQPKVLMHQAIVNTIEECKQLEGDIYDKAVCLLNGIVQKHPFASGNRRTAFVVVKEFLLKNNAPFKVKDDPSYARVMLGIREKFYKDEEIKEWIKNGKIREFRR